MATEIKFGDMTPEQEKETTNLIQKIQAIKGEIEIVNEERLQARTVFEKRRIRLEQELKVLSQALRAVRLAEIIEL